MTTDYKNYIVICTGVQVSKNVHKNGKWSNNNMIIKYHTRKNCLLTLGRNI